MKEDDEEIQRILDVLHTLIRMLGLSNREIERRLGLTPSYLSRLFGGYMEVRLEHLLSVARALGLKPGEFFEFVYPQRVHPPSESAQKLRNLLKELQPSQPPAPEEAAPKPRVVTMGEVERRVQEVLRQVFRDLDDDT